MPAYEGAIEDVSSEQLDFVAKVLEKHNFGDAKVTVNPVGQAGDNYVANVKRFVAEKDGETFKMVAKVAPTGEQLRQAGNTASFFHTEYTMYSEILPKFTELEIEAGIAENNRLRYATFYGAYMEPPHEIILLEDLQEPGFTILDRFKSLNNETIKLVLKNFARLHALSFALKAKEPEIFNDFKDKLINPWEMMTKDPNVKLYFSILESDACTLLESDKHRNAIKGKVGGVFETLQSLYKFDHNSRYSVIQQGDSWTNNIMFRMEGETPLECCMIDYQLSRVNSPVADLHYMIFNCTDNETRSQHFRDWIDYYHSQIDKELFEFGLKAGYCYPRDQLDADLKRHGKASLGQAVMLASVLTRQVAEAAKLKESMEHAGDVEEMMKANRIIDLDVETQHLFKTRVEGVIDTMFEMGLL